MDHSVLEWSLQCSLWATVLQWSLHTHSSVTERPLLQCRIPGLCLEFINRFRRRHFLHRCNLQLGCTLHTSKCTLHTANWKLQTSNYKPQISHFILKTAHCKLHSKQYTLHTAHCTMLIAEHWTPNRLFTRLENLTSSKKGFWRLNYCRNCRFMKPFGLLWSHCLFVCIFQDKKPHASRYH